MVRIPLVQPRALDFRGFDPVGGYQEGRVDAARLQDLAERRDIRAAEREQAGRIQARLEPGQDLETVARIHGEEGDVRTMADLLMQSTRMKGEAERLDLKRRADARAAASAGVTAEDRQRRLTSEQGLRSWASKNNIDPNLPISILAAAAKESIVPEQMTPYQRKQVELAEAEIEREKQEDVEEEEKIAEADERRVKNIQDNAISTAQAIDRAASIALRSGTAAGSGPGMAVRRFFDPEDRVALEGDLETIGARLAIKEISELVDKGVKLGVLSDSDIRMLQAIQGSLNADMRKEDLVERLQIVRNIMTKINPEGVPQFNLMELTAPTRRRHGRNVLPSVDVDSETQSLVDKYDPQR